MGELFIVENQIHKMDMLKKRSTTSYGQFTEWLKVDGLSLNIVKTKCILFLTKQIRITPQKQQYCLKSKRFNCLGHILNENLSWKIYCDKLSNSIFNRKANISGPRI